MDVPSYIVSVKEEGLIKISPTSTFGDDMHPERITDKKLRKEVEQSRSSKSKAPKQEKPAEEKTEKKVEK